MKTAEEREKKFILRRKMIYIETAEIRAESWEQAKTMLLSGGVQFERQSDGVVKDETIEFIGEEPTTT